MVVKSWKRPSSLLNLTINNITDNFTNFFCREKFVDALHYLPFTVKNRILKKLTSPSAFQKNQQYTEILAVLLNTYTEEADLTSFSLEDNLLHVMSKCINLRCLHLAGNEENKLSSKGVESLLENLPLLHTIILTNLDQITDDILKHLAEQCVLLMAVDLTGCKKITDQGLGFLAKLTSLTYVKLSNTKVSDQGIVNLVQGPSSSRIKELRLDGCANVTDLGLRAIGKYCKNIEVLIFNNCNKNAGGMSLSFDGAVFKSLKQLTWTIFW